MSRSPPSSGLLQFAGLPGIEPGHRGFGDHRAPIALETQSERGLIQGPAVPRAESMLVFSRTNPPPLRDPDFVLPAKVHDPRPAVSHWAIQQDRSKVNLGVSARGSCITSSRLSARTWGLLALCHSLKTSAWPGFCLRALPGIEPCPPSCGGFHSALHQKLMLR